MNCVHLPTYCQYFSILISSESIFNMVDWLTVWHCRTNYCLLTEIYKKRIHNFCVDISFTKNCVTKVSCIAINKWKLNKFWTFKKLFLILLIVLQSINVYRTFLSYKNPGKRKCFYFLLRLVFFCKMPFLKNDRWND